MPRTDWCDNCIVLLFMHTTTVNVVKIRLRLDSLVYPMLKLLSRITALDLGIQHPLCREAKEMAWIKLAMDREASEIIFILIFKPNNLTVNSSKKIKGPRLNTILVALFLWILILSGDLWYMEIAIITRTNDTNAYFTTSSVCFIFQHLYYNVYTTFIMINGT